ncbi:MAG TPA: tetratricopeptide repeat protein [Micropepsaceae bacterium]|jgi:predicted O-linked N-acetylglucosamine transferase (SPINDLY family)|nr:tetratricopeptide repeat protein [Micropepsaceae bacterium]
MNELLLRDARRAQAVGNVSDAARLYAQALRADARNVEALLSLGLLHAESGHYEDARRLLAEAVRLCPDSAAAHCAHGCALQGLGRNADALSAFDAALQRAPDHEEAMFRRANALLALRRFRECIAAYDLYLARHPDSAQSWHNRGVAFSELKRFAEARDSFSEAIALRPDSAQSWHNRGLVQSELQDLDAAIHDHERALSIAPDLPYARGHLVFAKLAACDWHGISEERAKIADAIDAGLPVIVPFGNIMISESPAAQRQCTQIWMGRHRATAPLWRGERYNHGRIRIAYVSGDFRIHPVSILMAGAFEHHDKSRFETIAISYGPDDGSTLRSRAAGAFEHFIDVRGKSDFDTARLLREMEADIVIDLMGPTAGCRNGIFAARPAPVQVNYLGYPGTMACGFMDYILADRIVIRADEERHYSEKIVYLPHTYLPGDDARAISSITPSRADAELPEHGFVFCSFNNTYKFTPEIFATWMRILTAVEGSVLWLPESNGPVRRNLVREAEARGVAGERIVFAPFVDDPAAHLARLRLADLFLDTLPCNAHTTASDALSAGLPVLTCKGTTFAGRVAASLLHAAELDELVTDSLPAYEAKAISLARDPAALVAIKAKLAHNRRAAPAFDTARFTRNLERAFEEMRARALRGETPQSFAVDESAS